MTATRDPISYARHQDAMAKRSRELSAMGREIGPIPPVRDIERKIEAMTSFRSFCELYFPQRFTKEFGPHHFQLMDRCETVVLHGGLHAVAMPRGEGKTTIVELVSPWAAMIGAHQYSFIVGASEPKAEEMLESIKTELAHNDLLLDDWPEVCYPIRMLDGETRRALGQLHEGNRTNMKWGPGEIRLPNVPGSRGASAVIRCAGITGNIRGAVRTLDDGRRVRPTLVSIDDPQTDESAHSPTQCDKRHRIIMGSILGLSGEGRQIAGIATTTVIREGDLSDRLLDREISPDWTGERTRMVVSFPTNEKLWDEYNEKRIESLEAHGDIRAATEFYKLNREAMDAGAEVSWPQRYNREGRNAELSAIQNAMNLRFRDERAFFAEYQNDPLPEIEPDSAILPADEIAKKYTDIPRKVIPAEATTLVSHIDVQDRMLWYGVAAFEDDFTGWAVDYGGFPDQRADYYTLRGVKHGFQQRYAGKGYGWEAQVYAALGELVERIAGQWRVSGTGGTMRPDLILIDAAYGRSTDTVYKFCQESKYAPILLPVFGRGIGAASLPMSEYKTMPGEKVGHNWKRKVGKGRSIAHGIYDANYYKSFLHERIRVGQGDSGSFALFRPDKGKTHRMLADQLTSEQRFVTEGRGRTVDEWKLVDKSRDNHFLDNFAGCCVAASMRGVNLPELRQGQTLKPARRVRFSDLQRKKMGA